MGKPLGSEVICQNSKIYNNVNIKLFEIVKAAFVVSQVHIEKEVNIELKCKK